MQYRVHGRASSRFALMLQINTNITARQRAEHAARTLSKRILSLEADERRRIARELHDSVGQYLTCLKIDLDLLAEAPNEKKKTALVSESLKMAEHCLKETRTISHLLHPPLLDEAGLECAIRWYLDGFGQRSGIKVNLDMPSDLGDFAARSRLRSSVLCRRPLRMFIGHSGASAVNVSMDVDDQQVWLEVKDNGKGIPEERLRAVDAGSGQGVGVAGMRERVRELRGILTIESSKVGTMVRISIPITASAETIGMGDAVPPQAASA